jgi:hypothetical protein
VRIAPNARPVVALNERKERRYQAVTIGDILLDRHNII